MKTFNKILAVYTEILSLIGSFFFLAFCACVLIQIIARNLLPSAPSWTEEAARYTFIYMVAFGSAIAIIKDEFVFVEFLRDHLEEKKLHKISQTIRVIVTVAMLALCLYVLIFAEPTFAFLKFRMVSTAMQIPMQYIYYSQVIMFALMALSAVFRLVIFYRDWNKTGDEQAYVARDLEETQEA